MGTSFGGRGTPADLAHGRLAPPPGALAQVDGLIGGKDACALRARRYRESVGRADQVEGCVRRRHGVAVAFANHMGVASRGADHPAPGPINDPARYDRGHRRLIVFRRGARVACEKKSYCKGYSDRFHILNHTHEP